MDINNFKSQDKIHRAIKLRIIIDLLLEMNNACKYLNMSEEKILALIRSNEIGCRIIDGKYFFIKKI